MENSEWFLTSKIVSTDFTEDIIPVISISLWTSERKFEVNIFCIVDWACGGQWNRAYQFVQLLVNAFTSAHVELVVFFDGTLKENRCLTTERIEYRQKTASVLKHIRMIGTPPPKIWWLPPSGLKTCLRNALRSLNVLVVSIRFHS